MRFLVDTNLPPALSVWLRAAGHDAEHAAAALSPQATDPEIWALALARDAVVITKDSDYVDLAARTSQGCVVLIRCGNLKLRDFQYWFADRLAAILTSLDAGERIVEAR